MDRARSEVDRESDMSGGTFGNLILMTLICVVIFVVFMAFRPAHSEEMPVYDVNGHYAGSVFGYGKTQTCTDRSGHFTGSAINQGNGTTTFYGRSGHVDAAGLNVRTAPNGNPLMSLVNGTPLIPLQKQGDWLLVAPACDLTPTWAWSWNAGVPLNRCWVYF